MSGDPVLALRFQQAYAEHQAGRLAEATAGYEAVLKAQPRHFDALHLLGVAALQTGDHATAARMIEQALDIQPEVALACQNLAAAYRGLGRHGDAADWLARKIALQGEDLASLEALADLNRAAGRLADAHELYRRLTSMSPTDASTWIGLGITQRELGRPAEAVQSFEQALVLDPDSARAATNLGISWQQQQQHVQALQALDRVLARQPAHAPAHNARALSLWQLGQLDEAQSCLDRAIQIEPGYADAYSNRGALHATRGQRELAWADYSRAIALAPDHAEAHNCLGALQASQRDFAAAIASYRRAIASRPDFAPAHNNLGVALAEAGQTQEALASYARAIAQQSQDPRAAADALANRATLWARARRYDAAARDARACLALNPSHPNTQGEALFYERMQCDWQDHAAKLGGLLARAAAGEPVASPFVTLMLSDDPALQLACARDPLAVLLPPEAMSAPGPAPSRRIRLAWVSADFHEHATAYLLAGVIEQFDKTRFELIAISHGPTTEDRWQLRLQQAFDAWIDIRDLSDDQAAARMRELGIDIAIDLKGYTNEGRPAIFRHRAAPLQVAYLGYPGTSGMDTMDYLIADAITIPPGDEVHYSEQVVRLPDSYQCNDDRRPLAARSFTRSELGLPRSGFVFCSFNNSYKITPEVFDVWMRLLAQVPGSVLWLLQDNPSVPTNLHREAIARGITADRLVFAARMPADEHLARQACADLFLDTWPVNAHTTASDALWAGLPLITLPGRSFASRVAASLLHAAGLPDCIALDVAGYEALARGLARDPERLARLRGRVGHARGSSALFDSRRTTRQLEAAFSQMHARRQAGEAPASFNVQPAD